jgi:citrate synthase
VPDAAWGASLDFSTGPAYDLMGFDIPMFTSIIAMSRIVGWTAHIIEQLDANVLNSPFGADLFFA